MRSILGRTIDTTTSYPVSASDIRRWALAVYYPETPPRQFWDEEFAISSIYGGIVAPAEFNPFAWGARETVSAVESSGGDRQSGALERQLGIEPPPFQFMLNGGLEHIYASVWIRPGDVITSRTAITEYKEREGRLGLMLFTTSEARWTNQRDELVATHQMTLIRY